MPNALNLEGIALTKDQGQWRRTAEEVAADVLAKHAADVDRTGEFPHEGITALREAKILGLMVPEEMGGPGGSIVTGMLVTEALAKGCTSTAMCYAMHQSTIPLMSVLADDEQQGLFIDRILEGEWLGAFAMSEPGSGNRIWHMDSYAVEQNGGFMIDSFKSFATSSGYADYYLVPVRANDQVGPTDLSLFVIDGRDEHIEPKGIWDGMGLRGNSSRPVHFNKVEVPAINRLGEPTVGFSYMMAYALPIYLVGLSAVYLGVAQAAMDGAIEHVKKRLHSDTGKTLATVETVQRYVGEMKIRIDQARAAVLRVAQMSDNATVLFNEFASVDLLDEIIRENPDDPYFVELAGLKVMASEMAVAVAHMAIQVCGGVAYRRGHVTERCYRDARAGSLMAPSDDTLKIVMGNQLLGTPQPWA
jgi:alkylation response protein AidB-like acyl-CoA dehydrogenase